MSVSRSLPQGAFVNVETLLLPLLLGQSRESSRLIIKVHSHFGVCCFRFESQKHRIDQLGEKV
jgi:hypothetical protein